MTAALDLRHLDHAQPDDRHIAVRLGSAPVLAPVPNGPARRDLVQPSATVTVLCPPADTRSTAAIRLTRRGVLVLSFAVAVLGLALVWLAAFSAPAAAPGSASGAAGAGREVTVRAGDTLWSIATRVAPSRDPRVEVAALQRVNGLRGSDVAPGQILRLP
jgi:hypothetical protein